MIFSFMYLKEAELELQRIMVKSYDIMALVNCTEDSEAVFLIFKQFYHYLWH